METGIVLLQKKYDLNLIENYECLYVYILMIKLQLFLILSQTIVERYYKAELYFKQIDILSV